MKKLFIFILCIVLLCSFVSAKHYFVGDDSNTINEIINKLKYLGDIKVSDFEKKENSDLTIRDLDNKITTVLYENKAVLIMGENSPATHAILAGEIGKFLKNEKGYNVLPAITSDEVISNDLFVLFGEALVCQDSDAKNYNLKGSATGVSNTGDVVTKRDSCTGKVLLERYCDKGVLRTDYYDCPDTCEDGRCVKIEVEEQAINKKVISEPVLILENVASNKPTPTFISEELEEEREEAEIKHEEVKEEKGVFFAFFSWVTNLFGF